MVETSQPHERFRIPRQASCRQRMERRRRFNIVKITTPAADASRMQRAAITESSACQCGVTAEAGPPWTLTTSG